MPISETEIDQVTDAVIGEALGEGKDGWAAVAHAIANRVDDSRYPGTITGVLGEKTGRKGYNAYSTFNKPSKEGTQGIVKGVSAAKRSAIRSVVDDVFSGKIADPTKGATSYYNKAGRYSSWHEKQGLKSTIGNHSFFGKTIGAPAKGIRGVYSPDPFAGYPASPIDAAFQFGTPPTGVPSFAMKPDAFTPPTPTARPDQIAEMRANSPFASTRDYDRPESIQANPDVLGAIAPDFAAFTRTTPDQISASEPDFSTVGASTPDFSRMGGGIFDSVETVTGVEVSAPSYSGIGSHGNSTTRGGFAPPSTPSPGIDPGRFSLGPSFATPATMSQNIGTPADALGFPTANRQSIDAIGALATPSTKMSELAAQYAAYRPTSFFGVPASVPPAAVRVAPPVQPSHAQRSVALATPSTKMSGLAAAQANLTATSIRSHNTPSGGTNFTGDVADMPGWTGVTNDMGVTTISDPVRGVSATRGAGGGEADAATVLCTHYNHIGWLDDETYAYDALYGMGVDADVMNGYHIWAVPFSKKLKKHKLLELAVFPFVLIWAKSMATPNTFWSRALCGCGEWICRKVNEHDSRNYNAI